MSLDVFSGILFVLEPCRHPPAARQISPQQDPYSSNGLTRHLVSLVVADLGGPLCRAWYHRVGITVAAGSMTPGMQSCVVGNTAGHLGALKQVPSINRGYVPASFGTSP